MVSNTLTSLRETVALSILYYLCDHLLVRKYFKNLISFPLDCPYCIFRFMFSSFPSSWFSLFLLLLINMVPVSCNIISQFVHPYAKLTPKNIEMSHTGS